MLKFIGAVVLIVLIIGPLLLQAGMLADAGLFRELIELEVRAFTDLIDLIRQLVADHTGEKP
jgi:hypothetical protein